MVSTETMGGALVYPEAATGGLTEHLWETASVYLTKACKSSIFLI